MDICKEKVPLGKPSLAVVCVLLDSTYTKTYLTMICRFTFCYVNSIL